MNRRCLTVLMIVGVILLFSLSASAQSRTGRILCSRLPCRASPVVPGSKDPAQRSLHRVE